MKVTNCGTGKLVGENSFWLWKSLDLRWLGVLANGYIRSYAITVLPAAICDKQKREDGKDWGGELIYIYIYR